MFLIDFGIALRSDVTAIPIAGKANWSDETGGMYVEVDPTDDLWIIPGRDHPTRGNSAECVAYIQHCWEARAAVDEVRARA